MQWVLLLRCAVFAEAATHTRMPGATSSVRASENVAVLLNAAQNGMYRAWRAHGNPRDPMGRVFRKADDLLLTALAGVYVEGLVRPM